MATKTRAVCLNCGRDFAPYDGGNHPVRRKRCTAKADMDLDRVVTMACKECGKEFTAPSRVARESARRRMADPEILALASARRMAWVAAHRGDKGGRGEGRSA